MAQQGAPVPERFMAEPPVAGQPFWEAFWVLGARRTMGGGMMPMPNPIAFSEIAQYAEMQGLEVDETVDLVGQLDAAWISHMQQQVKASAERMKPKAEPEDE